MALSSSKPSQARGYCQPSQSLSVRGEYFNSGSTGTVRRVELPQKRAPVEIADIRNERLSEADARERLSTYMVVRLEKTPESGWMRPEWEARNPRHYALKTLHSKDKRHYAREVATLGLLNEAAHRHIVPLLSTYKTDDEFHLLFPWADCDLSMLWRLNPRPRTDSATCSWLVRQMEGLADGLSVIHGWPDDDGPRRWFGCHGDIKPANILAFYENGDDDPRDFQNLTLKFCDFGDSCISMTEDGVRRRHRETRHTPAYRAPELDLRPNEVSTSYDIWSLGCVFLEATTWMILGSDGLEMLADSRADTASDALSRDAFFQLFHTEDGSQSASLKPWVEQWISALRYHPHSSPLIDDLLDLITQEMLVIETADHVRRRLSSRDVKKALSQLREKLLHVELYSTPRCPCASSGECLEDHFDDCIEQEDLLKMAKSPFAQSCSTLERASLTVAFSQVHSKTPARHGNKRKRLEASSSTSDTERSKKAKDAPAGQKKFACPFGKAGVDGSQMSRSCWGPGWSEVHRVKEHINRCHTPANFKNPLVCGRCLEGFKSQGLLMQHQRKEPQCLIKAPEIIHGKVSLEQAANLRSTKRKGDMSDEEKWMEWYRILFPAHDPARMPLTPYHEDLTVSSIDTLSTQSSTGMSEYRNYVHQPLTRDKQERMEAKFSELGVPREYWKHLAATYRDFQREDLQEFNEDKVKPTFDLPQADNLSKPDVAPESGFGFDPLEGNIDGYLEGWNAEGAYDNGLDFLANH